MKKVHFTTATYISVFVEAYHKKSEKPLEKKYPADVGRFF